jgi:hypothetical protein
VFLIVQPELVPGPALVAGVLGSGFVIVRNRSAVALGPVGWTTLGRFPGIAAGLPVVALMAARSRVVLTAAIVALGLALSATRYRLRPRPATLAGAGALSGFMSVTAALGGPPLGLLYQHERGTTVRAALASFALVSGMLSLAALIAVGRFGRHELALSLYLLPGLAIGAAASTLTHRMSDARVRPLLLGTCAAAVVVILARAIA